MILANSLITLIIFDEDRKVDTSKKKYSTQLIGNASWAVVPMFAMGAIISLSPDITILVQR